MEHYMISEGSIKEISHLFCGDIEGYFSYKSGPQLVSFFRKNFGSEDQYGQGFPSRWAYVYDKIVDMLNNSSIDSFFSLILSKEYLMQDTKKTAVESAELSANILTEFNRILGQDFFKITHVNGNYQLVQENDDLVLIGSGGFANVYRQKSTGLILKKLKDDFITDSGIRSRFKREFSLTQSLSDLAGIIRVFDFDAGTCSYTMELAETTLEQYVRNNPLSDINRITCIYQVLQIMTEVHKRDIIHRDLSPNNIFIISGQLKIADFGLGKDLNVFTSHQTLHTNAVGQYYYCAPEQFMMLRNADKRSDVYSLGRIINFVMTGDPCNSHHDYRAIAEKATNSDSAYRYGDAGQLEFFFRKSVQYHAQQENKDRVERKIRTKVFDAEIESYIYNLSADKISKGILNTKSGFIDALIAFMNISDRHAQHIIQNIDKSFRDVCGHAFDAYDPFASFAYRVLQGSFSFVVKETAANILRCVAWDINRFSAQHLVDQILSDGIDPMLEDIIRT